MSGLKILTWNVYLGADVANVINAPAAETPRRMTALLRTAERTDFAVRSKAIAKLIARSGADLVSLQEVYRWSTVVRRPLNEGPPEETVRWDFLPMLLDALNAEGTTYFAAARSNGIDVMLPTTESFDVRMQDSVAILLRAGVGAPPLTWERPQQGRFRANLLATLGGDPFVISRGWCSVDLRGAGEALRVINTHIEFYDANVQPAQVTELLEGPASTAPRVILTGDFNCRPETPAWNRLVRQHGFTDAWTAGSGDGMTSSRDADLRGGTLYERIDWILCGDGIDVSDANLVGVEEDDRIGGMWPSDHAGVLATVIAAPFRSARRTDARAPDRP